MTDTVLSVQNLNVVLRGQRADKRILQNVSFTVRRGRALGIVGPSGSGKTTAAHAVCGLLPRRAAAVSGSIMLDGTIDLLKLSGTAGRQAYARRLALIPQDAMNALNPYARVGAQLDETLRLHHGRVDRDTSCLRDRLLEQLGLPADTTILKQYPHQLSGGMRQRVVIALALLSQAEVLIADEPTTALDTLNQARFLSLLANICGELALTLIYISHDLAIISSLCEDVAVMYEGRVVESGVLAEVFSRPRHPYTQAMVSATSRLLNGGGVYG